MMRYLLNKRTLRIIVLLVLDGLFFGLTNPNRVNSILLIGGFILFGATIYFCIDGLLSLILLTGLKLKDRHRLALFASLIITALIVLQSLGQLTVKDGLVIVPLAVIAYIYSSKIRK